jgi:hypothetical protein
MIVINLLHQDSLTKDAQTRDAEMVKAITENNPSLDMPSYRFDRLVFILIFSTPQHHPKIEQSA